MIVEVGQYLTYSDDKNEVIHTVDEPIYDTSVYTWDNFEKVYRYVSDIPQYQPVSYNTEDITPIIYDSEYHQVNENFIVSHFYLDLIFELILGQHF